MKTILLAPDQIITVDSNRNLFKRGKEMNDISLITNHSILIENGRIIDIIPTNSVNKILVNETINCEGKIVLPGLVECHTHSLFSGSRANEFKMKLEGETYESIARKGGGILSTVANVKNSSENELLALLLKRINKFISQGVTTLELKSGYGLEPEVELKMLRVINKAKEISSIKIIPTLLGAHAIPNSFKEKRNEFLTVIEKELIPTVAKDKLAKFFDAFCEKSAFSQSELAPLFDSAIKLGLLPRLHTDQFNSIGGLEYAIQNNFVSVDHLEIIDVEQTKLFHDSTTVGVLLPGVSYTLRYDYAPARKLIDNNAIVSLATDFNPGSCHISNIFLIMQLAALNMKMTFEEIISSYTINSAFVLRESENIGSIEIGKQADFAIFACNDYLEILYSAPENLNYMTIKEGKIIYQQKEEI